MIEVIADVTVSIYLNTNDPVKAKAEAERMLELYIKGPAINIEKRDYKIIEIK